MNAVSLFTGAGGFDLGFERAGGKVIAQVEIGKYANQVLRRRYMGIPQVKDIRDARGKELAPSGTDVVMGGSPCQDVSIAGRRAGLAGERSRLWWEQLRLIDEIKPAWVLWENVPGVLTSNEGGDFAVILRSLVECGYRVAWRVLDSQYFGVPQRRRRLYAVGHIRDGRAAHVLFDTQSLPGSSATRPPAWQNDPDVSPTLPASGSGTSRPGGQGAELDFYVYRQRRFGDFAASAYTPALKSRDYKSVADVVAYDARNHKTSDVSATLQAKPNNGGHSLNYINPVFEGGRVRRLTPRECERLQGFPDDWTATGVTAQGETVTISDSQRYKMMGNAVTVNVAEWIARRMMEWR